MTNNHSPDMPECQHAWPNMAAPRDLKCMGCGKTWHEAYSPDALNEILAAYEKKRADLIKPEPAPRSDKKCDFCGSEERKYYIPGPMATICNECVNICNHYIADAEGVKPEPVADLEAIKADKPFTKTKGCDCHDCGVWDACIDHLAAQGHLRPAVPREVIEKAYYALERASHFKTNDGQKTFVAETLAALKPYVEGK